MKTASIFEAKTNLSKYIAAICTKQEPYVVIVKSGKPVARLIPYEESTASRIGVGKDIIPSLESLDIFNEVNVDIARDFSGNGGLL